MGERIVIVGAGLIGCMIALRLAEAGRAVTVIDSAGIAAGASGTSFGWINASFYQDADHHRLRAAGLAAYDRLLREYPQMPVQAQSCLWFEAEGAALEEMAQALADLSYPVERIDRDRFRRLAPDVRAPLEALHFPAERVVDAGALTLAVARAAQARGVRFALGTAVTGLVGTSRVAGVVTAQGTWAAETVIVAAGVGAAALIGLPMLARPGLLMATQPLPRILNHVLVAPEGEIKQDAAGRLVMPTAAGHQGDVTERLSQTPDVLADAALVRLQARVPDQALRWTQVAMAHRPVPQDGLPVIGAVRPGLYAAVMHSGVTLAALVGELAAAEIAGEGQEMLAPYRPGRFPGLS